ncbi:hypothetical protein TOPH_08624 [Tolypocladium ophioglossoides CBS 100239]|uniref:Uncharacterized protein n=1 Tax=Tolypocladium ophioglossoides (strain CBS 100239) TaxID=1163406 RepID=A0A0L0MY76_TOLOC|nr:hypothetical protein TOPH_08624 [Tolypocladium ophioglossoides CBS 100239]
MSVSSILTGRAGAARSPRSLEVLDPLMDLTKTQSTEDATIETILGEYPRFLWSAMGTTTYRSNTYSLVTTWTAFVPSLCNFALLWDVCLIRSFTQTRLYTDSNHKGVLLGCLCGWIYLRKLVKLLDYFWSFPKDLILFFFPIPEYPAFAYFHSLLKPWAALTFWDGSWAGRDLSAAEEK